MARRWWRSRPSSAEDGKVTAGGGGEAPIDIGIPPAALPALIEAATGPPEDLTDAQWHELERDLLFVRAQLGVSAGALDRFLRDIGEAAVPPERQPEHLAEIAARHKDLLAWVERTASGDPRVRELEEARAAIEAGEYNWAEQLLNEAKTAAVGDACRPRAAAEAAAGNGELAMIRLRYRRAAAYFTEAADLLPGDGDEARAAYLDRQGDAARRGGDHGAAARARRAALAVRGRVHAPDDPWPAYGPNAPAVALGATGRHAEAEPLRRRAIATGEDSPPAGHPDRSWSREDHAVLLDAPGRGDGAARLPGNSASGPAFAASLLPWEAFDSHLGKGSPGEAAQPEASRRGTSGGGSRERSRVASGRSGGSRRPLRGLGRGLSRVAWGFTGGLAAALAIQQAFVIPLGRAGIVLPSWNFRPAPPLDVPAVALTALSGGLWGTLLASLLLARRSRRGRATG
jgi:tetratricopeptide (TPR) repeat protein